MIKKVPEDIVATEHPYRILTINSGSSSLKFSLYSMGQTENLVLSGNLERIGLSRSFFRAREADGQSLIDQDLDLPDHKVALKTLFEWLQKYAPGQKLEAVGHRVVHGGSRFSQPHLVTPEMMEVLQNLAPIDPDHLPHELKAINSVSRIYPALKQVACFDTAFHRHMPKLAQMVPVPRFLWNEGVLRYGFHGLSYEYIMLELARETGPEVALGRVIIAHLGNGASMAAVRSGKSTDTTMGFAPTGGLMMGTRTGDLDPGILLYLLQEKGLHPLAANHLVNEQAGLLGVSGISSDMKDLLDKSAENPHADEAIALFCYQAKKFLGAMTMVLGGLDTLIFTGGIGENAPSIRSQICKDTEFIGIHLDIVRNDANAPIISRDDSGVAVRVMKTNEELMIARHTFEVIRREKKNNRD